MNETTKIMMFLSAVGAAILLFMASSVLTSQDDGTQVAQYKTTNYKDSPDGLIKSSVSNDSSNSRANVQFVLAQTDSPADEECLTYETTGTTTEWQSCGSGGAGSTVTADYNGTQVSSVVTNLSFLGGSTGPATIAADGQTLVISFPIVGATLANDSIFYGSGGVAIATDLSDYIAAHNAGTASALASGTSCTGIQVATGLADGANVDCATITDDMVPDSITIDLAAVATSLAANGANCSAGQAPLGVDASGAAEGCFTPSGGSGGATNTADEDGITISSQWVNLGIDQGLDASTSSTDLSISLDILEASLPSDYVWWGAASGLAVATPASDLIGANNAGTATAAETQPIGCSGLQVSTGYTDAQWTANCVSITDQFLVGTITADQAPSDPANCPAGEVTGGVSQTWTAQSCLDPITETEMDSESELEAQLVGVSDVFTNNDGALDDDDITDDSIGSLSDVNFTSPEDGAIPIYDTGTGKWRDATMTGDAMLDDSGVITLTDPEPYTHACNWILLPGGASQAADEPMPCHSYVDFSVTLTDFFCITDTGSASVTADYRTRAGTYSSGTGIGVYNCTSSGTSDTPGTTIPAGSGVTVTIGTISDDALGITILGDLRGNN